MMIIYPGNLKVPACQVMGKGEKFQEGGSLTLPQTKNLLINKKPVRGDFQFTISIWAKGK